jgi:hypothetical protein
MELLFINVAPLPGVPAVGVCDPTAHHGVTHVIVTPGFGRQTKFKPYTCQDQQFTYTAVI